MSEIQKGSGFSIHVSIHISGLGIVGGWAGEGVGAERIRGTRYWRK